MRNVGLPRPLDNIERYFLELRDYLRILRRNWLMVTSCTLIGLTVAAGGTLLVKPSYTARTQLFVATQSSGSVQELQQGNTFSQQRVQSYAQTVKTPTVLQPAIDALTLSITAEQLASKVTATTDVNTVIINVSVSDSSPSRARELAGAIGASLIEAVETLEKPADGGNSPVKLSTITPAVDPSSPSSPNFILNAILGFLVGLGIGMGSAFLRNHFDSRITGETEVRRVTDAPVLGSVALDPSIAKSQLVTQLQPQGHGAESYRQLRTNLQFAHVSHQSKSILITSSVPGEGKSTTAANLAIALAQGGQSVVLVDADLRRPMISNYFNLDATAGLTTALLGQANVDDFLQPWGDDALHILASGQVPPNPSELLGSVAMRRLLEQLENSFDVVIIDAPPLLPVTDSNVLAQHVGGVVVVVGSRKTRTTDLQKSLEGLALVGADILGLVLNMVPSKGPDSHSYGYYSAESLTPTWRPELVPNRKLEKTLSSLSVSNLNHQDSSRFVREGRRVSRIRNK